MADICIVRIICGNRLINIVKLRTPFFISKWLSEKTSGMPIGVSLLIGIASFPEHPMIISYGVCLPVPNQPESSVYLQWVWLVVNDHSIDEKGTVIELSGYCLLRDSNNGLVVEVGWIRDLVH